MKLIIAILLSMSALNALATSCTSYELTDIKTSGDLASMMGKHRVFDVDLMMKYDDDVQLPQGEVILLEHKIYKPEFIVAKMINGKQSYTLSNGQKFERNSAGRLVANEKKVIRICLN